MKIKDLKPGLSDVELEARVISVSQPKVIESKEDGTQKKKKEVLIGDDTGTVRLVIWNIDVSLKQGDVIRIRGAWTVVYKDKIEVQAGKWTKIEKIDSNTVPPIDQIPDEMPVVEEYKIPLKKKQS